MGLIFLSALLFCSSVLAGQHELIMNELATGERTARGLEKLAACTGVTALEEQLQAAEHQLETIQRENVALAQWLAQRKRTHAALTDRVPEMVEQEYHKALKALLHNELRQRFTQETLDLGDLDQWSIINHKGQRDTLPVLDTVGIARLMGLDTLYDEFQQLNSDHHLERRYLLLAPIIVTVSLMGYDLVTFMHHLNGC